MSTVRYVRIGDVAPRLRDGERAITTVTRPKESS